jgi:primary-amine oxidase
LKYGTLIAPNLVAPIHQHFFNVRLDFAVDGIENTVEQVDVVSEYIDDENDAVENNVVDNNAKQVDENGVETSNDDENELKNAFYAKKTVYNTEKESTSNLNFNTMRTWRIFNPNKKNYLNSDYVGYKFFPGDNSLPLASKKSWWRKRARFVDNHVCVTPFQENEQYASGKYANQSTGDDGLHKYIEQNRSINNKDVVFWYTFGHTHIPRLEDFPVMPVNCLGFKLKPNGFFSQNPSNDVPPLV